MQSAKLTFRRSEALCQDSVASHGAEGQNASADTPECESTWSQSRWTGESLAAW